MPLNLSNVFTLTPYSFTYIWMFLCNIMIMTNHSCACENRYDDTPERSRDHNLVIKCFRMD